MHMLNKLQGKIVIFDFDGVLYTYRAEKNKTHVTEEEYLRRFIGDKANDVYAASWAPASMSELIAKLDPNLVYVLSDMAHTFELRKKQELIREYYPNIKEENVLFTRSSYKGIVIDEMYNEIFSKMGYAKQDIIMVEDSLDVIQSIEKFGYTCYHISMFI